MSQRNGLHLLFAAAIGFLVVFGCAGYAVAQRSHMLPASPAAQPIKVDIRPTANAYRAGQVVKMEITLRDAYDHVVPSPGTTEIVVKETDPAGKPSSETLTFVPGATIRYFQFPANSPGFYQVIARQAQNHLRQGSYRILVSQGPHHGAHLFLPARGISRAAIGGTGELRPVALRWGAARPPQQPDDACPTPSAPCLLLEWVNDQDDLLADGVSAAEFSVVYRSPDWSPAPTDIHVTLKSGSGELKPNVLTIPKGQGNSTDTAMLTSKKQTGVDVWIQSSQPYYAPGVKEREVKFGSAIWGIRLTVPDSLPLVDTATVTAELLGPHQQPYKADSDTPVTFSLNNSKVRLATASNGVEIKKGTSAVSIPLIPEELGKTNLQAFAASLSSPTKTVNVTGLAAILLCLAGGVVGGLCAFDAFKGSLFWRIFLGIVGGAFLTWMYVSVGRQETSWHLPVGLFGALFVSILGGFMGLHVLNLAAKRFGLMPEQSNDEAQTGAAAK